MKKILFVFIAVFFTTIHFSQNNQIEFKHYSRQDGLTSTSIKNIAQDDYGFLWICKNNGISRFNGYEFEDFNWIFNNKENLTLSYISSLKNGNILISTVFSGLFIYHPKTNTLKQYTHQENKENSINSNYVTTTLQDSKNRIWVGTWFGLSLMDSNGNFKNYPFNNSGSKKIYNYNTIEDIVEAQDGTLWIATWGGGLHQFNPYTEKFEHYEKLPNANKNLWVKKIIEQKNGNLFLATIDDGVLEFDIQKKLFTSVDYKTPSTNPGYKRCLDVTLIDKYNLWIATEEGLVIYNLSSKTTTFINDQGTNQYSLQNKRVNGFFKDNHNGLWIIAGGLSYYNKKATKFDLYQKIENQSSLSDNEVYSFLEINKNEIWISTKNGINIWDREKNQFTLIKPFLEPVHILKKWKNVVYAAIPRRGLYTFNLHTKQVKSYDTSLGESFGLVDNHIMDMDFDADGNLWIGTLSGLSCLKKEDEKFLHFVEKESYKKGLKSPSVPYVSIVNNEVWLSNYRRVLKLNVKKSLIEDKYAGVVEDTTQYSLEMFKQFPIIRTLESKDSLLFIGTLNKFIVYNLKSKEEKVFTEEDGLASSEINSIATDYKQGIWLGKGNGLSYINLQTNELSNFYREDGLQSNFFKENSKLTLSTGEVLLGGNNGFNAIDIDDVELNPYSPKTAITKILVYNNPLEIKNPIAKLDKEQEDGLKASYNYIDQIKLNHKQNSITFEFSSLNFLNSKNNQLAYFIEGVDKDWNYIKNRRYVSFNNLPEGKWLTLKVKGSNNDGIWSLSQKTLQIYIDPPIYNTVWFRLLLALFFIGVIVLLYKIRIRNLKQQRNNLEQEVLKRTKQIKEQTIEIEKQNKTLKEKSSDLVLQNKNIALFSEIGQQITSAINISDIFNKTFEQIKSIYNIDHIAIGRRSAKENTMLYWEMHTENINKQTIALTNTTKLSALALKENRKIISNNIKEDIYEYLENPNPDYFSQPYNSVVYVPLKLQSKEPTGIFVAKSKNKNMFNEKNINFLENICIYLTIAIENAWAYDQIKKQSEKLKELDRIKTKFYANISHEFRTPLSLIIGPADEIKNNTKLSLKDKEYLEIITQNAKRMLKLVTQVLDLSKLEDGVLKLNVAEGNISKSIKNIVDSFGFMAERKNIKLYFSASREDIIGYFDLDKIEKITYNILNNAFKYTNSNGTISVKISTFTNKQQQEFATVVFKDTGIGIPLKDIQSIFKNYFRAENANINQQYGAGIGLSLVKKLTELHYGTITVDSEEHKGSTFTLNIPLSANCYKKKEISNNILPLTNSLPNLAEQFVELEDRSDINIKKLDLKNVLIVEDNQDLLRFMVNSLENKYNIDVVSNGLEALNSIVQKTPDIIISDVMMPKMDGFQLTKELKSNPKYAHIPVILLTAKNSFESQMQGLEYGADQYLIKPVNIKLLEKYIENLITTFNNVKDKFESKLVKDIENLEVNKNDSTFLKKVVEILEENITNPEINIDFFTDKLGMSRTLLYEKIKKATGDSMGVFIRKNRLNYAAKLLLENHHNTSELAYEVGYTDPKYFSKSFKKQFGKTPREFLQEKLKNLS